ncbi:MAG: type II toxin-antitoxin system HicA family toxin [bacterium]|nr:type II toxin-antitoxin system HicA family toxin [bacterium]
MRVPSDVSGQELSRLLGRYGYHVTRQTGAHLRLTTMQNGEHHVTIPNHDPLKVGTLSAILNDVSAHLKLSKEGLVRELFG